MSKLTRGLITVGVLAIVWLLPQPHGVTVQGWKMFGIFLATVVGLLLQPVPFGAVCLISISFANISGVLTMGETLAAYSNPIIWLILSAYLLSRAMIVTGLGRRISFMMIAWFGSSTLRLAYAMAASDLLVSPVIPANSARSGGVIFPVVRSLCSAYGSEPGPTARRAGAFLMKSTYDINATTSAMFITAMGGNLLCVDFAAKVLNIKITWSLWAMASIVPGILSLIAIPLFLYIVYPPEVKYSPEAQAMARGELVKMGPISRNEKAAAGVFVGALLLWATSQLTGIDATLVAFLAVCVLLLLDVLTWDDVMAEKGSWDVFLQNSGLLVGYPKRWPNRCQGCTASLFWSSRP